MKIADTFQGAVTAETVRNLNLNASSTFVVDGELRLVFTNDAWDRFALENEGEAIGRDWSLGRCILDAMAEVLKPFYREMYAKIMGGEVIFHEYECSSPGRFRKYKMIGYPFKIREFALVDNTLIVDGGIEDAVDATEDRIGQVYLQKDGGALVQCSHCRRVRHGEVADRWDFVPAALNSSRWPISHGLCQTCLEHYYPAAEAIGG